MSIDVRMDGAVFASSGTDGCIKIWDLESEPLQERIKAATPAANQIPKPSEQPRYERSLPPPLFVHFPLLTEDTLHRNGDFTFYVDRVCWVGNLMLSRSSEGRAVLWSPDTAPVTPKKPGEDFLQPGTVLGDFHLRSADIWFLRFNMDPHRVLFALGNKRGETTVWNVDKRPIKQVASFCQANGSTVRHTAISHDLRFLVTCHDDASVVLWELPRNKAQTN